MSLRRVPRRMVGEPIIALVDVVFFLLVFFMLVARLDATAPFEVLPPNAVSGEDMPGGGTTVSISILGDIAVNGDASGEDWVADVSQATALQVNRLIRINAHRDTALRHVLPIIDELERADIGRVVLVVTPPRAP